VDFGKVRFQVSQSLSKSWREQFTRFGWYGLATFESQMLQVRDVDRILNVGSCIPKHLINEREVSLNRRPVLIVNGCLRGFVKRRHF
jgi:hypothetical protein